MKQPKLDLEPLIAAVHASAEAFFRLCAAQAADESITGLAVCPDNDVTSFYWMATTREANARQASEWLEEGNKSDPSLGYDMKTALDVFQYQVPDWHYSEETFDHPPEISSASNMLDEIWEKLESEEPEALEDDEMYERIVNGLRTAVGIGLGRFNNGFDYKVDRDEFTLLVFDPDPSDPEAIRSIAKAINPPIPFEAFSSQYNMTSLDDE